ALAAEYHAAAYGPDGALVLEYLDNLTSLFDYSYLSGERPAVSPEAAQSFRSASTAIEAFQPVITRNLGAGQPGVSPAQASSWALLDLHARIFGGLARALEARAKGEKDEARRGWEQVRGLVYENHFRLHESLDAYNFSSVLSH